MVWLGNISDGGICSSVDVSPYQQVFRFAFKSEISSSSCTQHIAICMITMGTVMVMSISVLRVKTLLGRRRRMKPKLVKEDNDIANDNEDRLKVTE